MNNTFSLEQISRTGNLDANFLLRQQRLDLMARLLKTKSIHLRIEIERNNERVGVFKFYIITL